MKKASKIFERVVSDSGMDVPIHFVPSITSYDSGHIDCDYLVIDSIKTIYANPNVFNKGVNRYFRRPIKKIEKVALQYNYDLRKYMNGSIDQSIIEAGQAFYFLSGIVKGINGIINENELFTSSLNNKEKQYLEERGIEAIIIPIGRTSPGAGLRCNYGEFKIPFI